MMPHDLIYLTLRRVQSQFQREEEYFAFLGTFDRCYNPIHGTVTAARHISDNICVNELRNEPEVACKHLFTTEKLEWVIYSRLLLNFEIFQDHYEMSISQ